MKLEFIVFLVTVFFAVDTYNDNKYTQLIIGYKKYAKVAGICFVGLSLLLFLKKNPSEGRGLMSNIHNMVKFMPVDKNTSDLLTPLFQQNNTTPQFKRMMNSGSKTINKRSVSETKKKYVASEQGWKCAHCNQQLSSTYEVDHIHELANGGSNHISNLEALCRNCHGKKTQSKHLE